MKTGEDRREFLRYNIARPLWVFVGSKVNTSDSDVVKILQFLASFVKNEKGQSIREIGDLLREGLLTANNTNLLAGHFGYLRTLKDSAEQLVSENSVARVPKRQWTTT